MQLMQRWKRNKLWRVSSGLRLEDSKNAESTLTPTLTLTLTRIGMSMSMSLIASVVRF